MKKTSLSLIALFSVSMAHFAFSDTIYFNNGEEIKGSIIEQNKKTLTIKTPENTTSYPMSDIKKVDKSEEKNKEIGTIPSGSVLHIKLTETISTRTNETGSKFKAKLESNFLVSGIVVANKGSVIYGTVIKSKKAGKVAGKSHMTISLTSISINKEQIQIQTNKLKIAEDDSQVKNHTHNVIKGAVIGELINGSDGAKDGAKVGAGVAALTNGQNIGIKKGTIIDFTISKKVHLP